MKKIKVLWICNMMPSFVGTIIGVKATNKEGWIAGIYEEVKKHNDIELAVAFPYSENISGKENDLQYYGFVQDNEHPENIDRELKNKLCNIFDAYKPQVIHGFGTEFPHTRAMLEVSEYKERMVIHLQGLMEECARVYYTNLPERVIKLKTFRDRLKSDSIIEQKEKFEKRAASEAETLLLLKNVCGRTDFDREYVKRKAPQAKYFRVNETLRPVFYEGKWDGTKCDRHRIFISQGNYPLKGLHDALMAFANIKDKYADAMLYVAGDDIVRGKSLKDKIKEPAYGRYLKEIIKNNNLSGSVFFLGQQSADEMKEQLLKSECYVLPSYVENSPNSLGEAMLLGTPVVCTNAGGIPTMTSDESESLMYDPGDIKALSEKILRVFEDDELKNRLSENSRKRAFVTHNSEQNYKDLLEVYKEISEEQI